MNITVIGAGSWGTAISGVAARRADKVTLWSHDIESRDGINERHVNPLYLSDYTLPENVVASCDYAEALAVIDEALAKNPLSVQLRFQRCVAYEKKGDTARAVKLYEDFITRYPEIPEPYNNLAAILASQGNLDRAQSLVERSLALRPSFALAYDNLGQIYLAKARNAFDSALANAPGNRTIEKKLRAVDAILK